LFIQDPNLQALRAPVLDFLAAIRRLDLSDTRFPAIAVPPESTIERVVGKLFATKIHRVFVATDSNGYKPEAVISLTDLLEFLLDDEIPNAIKVDKS
jgi:CBS domain-containing protein